MGNCKENVQFRLADSHCLPILTYGIEVLFVSDNDEKRQLRVAYNSMFCRIFHIRPFDSVTELQSLLHCDTWEQLVEKRKSRFMVSMKGSENEVLRALIRV